MSFSFSQPVDGSSLYKDVETNSLFTHIHTHRVPAIPVSHDVIAKSQHGNICHIHLVSCCAVLCVCVCVCVLLYPWCWNSWPLYMLAIAVKSVVSERIRQNSMNQSPPKFLTHIFTQTHRGMKISPGSGP